MQLKVVATDKGDPPRSDETYVEVTILRDKGLLKFGSTMYNVRVSENKEENSEIVRVSASPSVSEFACRLCFGSCACSGIIANCWHLCFGMN